MAKQFTYEEMWQLNRPLQNQQKLPVPNQLIIKTETQINQEASEGANKTTSEKRMYCDRLAREKFLESLKKAKQEISRSRININLTLQKEENKIGYQINLLKQQMKRENNTEMMSESDQKEKKLKRETSSDMKQEKYESEDED